MKVRFAHSRSCGTIAALALVALAAGVPTAQAQITVPIPTDVGPAPPPLPSLPPAGPDAPPAEAIADPVTPEAVCGDWYLQSAHANTWATGSSWWEYRCDSHYPTCEPQCNANFVASSWMDYFYWDGSKPVFYGEFYGDYYLPSQGIGSPCEYWWDAPTSQWYRFESLECTGEQPPANAPPAARFTVGCAGSSCGFDASASSDSDGTITEYSWTFGDGTRAGGATAEHAYAAPGSYVVELTVIDDDGGWTRDSKVVTIEPPPPPNAAPTAAFSFSCTALSCSFDAGGSSDSDGTIQAYRWSFGDSGNGTGETVQHSYAQTGTYTVRLTVTDEDSAAGATSKAIALIGLTARGFKAKGVQKVELSWNRAAGVSYDVFRNGARVATVSAGTYMDAPGGKGSGSYRYTVCEVGTQICSNDTTVTF